MTLDPDEILARIDGTVPLIRLPVAAEKPFVDLREGDCREVLKELDDNSVDSIVTDPPYGLEFMGKDWDAPWKTDRRQTFDGTLNDQRENPYGRSKVRNGTGASYGADARIMRFFQEWCETWAVECLRVLKPGGHLLAFGGSRTYHRLASAVEDAGFEIRDQIQWVYASGFPKSHDAAWDLHVQASQACGPMVEIDHGEPATEHDLRFVRATYLQTPVYACAECGKVLQPFVPEQGAQAYRAAWSKSEASWAEQPFVEGRGNLETPARKLQGCEVCSLPFGLFADGAEGRVRHGASHRHGEIPWQVAEPDGGRPSYRPQSVKQLANQLEAVRLECRAQEFRGYGTALKPAHEPIVMARKPLIGTVATNLAKYGVGALNIDGCRVATEEHLQAGAGKLWSHYRDGKEDGQPKQNDLGRWPANVIHDGSDEVLAAFPNAPGQMAGASTSSSRKTQNVYGDMKRGNGRENEPSADSANEGTVGFKMKPGARRLDAGSAARFFYCAKSSKSDRNEGLDSDAIVSILGAWENADQKVTLQVAMGTSRPKVTAVSGASTSSASEWSTLLFGSPPTGLYQTALKSITETKIRSTIASTIFASFLTFGTSESIPVAISTLTGLSGNPAESAEHTGLSLNITSEKMASALGASRAALPVQLKLSVSVAAVSSTHPTVKPTPLMQYLTRLVTPPGGTVLDPFMGSGSTGRGAVLEGFSFIGIEMDAAYYDIADARIAAVEKKVRP